MKAPILKGEKIILKPLNLSQAGNFVHWLKNKEVNKFLSADQSNLNLKKEKEFIKKTNQSKNEIRWAIYTKYGVHIGGTGLQKIDKYNHFKAEWGIIIGDKNYWNKGLGTDVLKTILKFFFKNLKLNRLELGVFPLNKGGLRCYEKCGFKFEGIKKQSFYKNGKFLDEIIMAITKNDYNKLNKKYVRRKK